MSTSFLEKNQRRQTSIDFQVDKHQKLFQALDHQQHLVDLQTFSEIGNSYSSEWKKPEADA